MEQLKKRWYRNGRSWRSIFLWLAGLFALACVFGGVALLWLSSDLPSVEQFDNRTMPQSTRIYDREGKVLLYEISAGEKRAVVPEDQVPQSLKDATVAIEDQNFYAGPAFDWRGILRSVWVNLTHGKLAQGGSTITQQLARNAFLSPEKTITRKVRELILAIQLSQHYSKDKVLWLYLNEIPYGPTIYGAGTASMAYFNKPLQNINLAEAAVLAALPQAPSHFSPWGSHVQELLDRQRLVLKRMLDLKKITKEQYDEALATKVSFEPQNNGIKAPHFTVALQDYLVKKYGEDMVRTGGLQIRSTLDWDLQQAAEQAVKDGAERNTSLYKGRNAALVAEDPQTGQLLAYVGSKDYFDTANQGNFNVPMQGLRQPGSALKPFVYLTAFAKGFLPDTMLFDVPTEFASNNPNCPILPPFNDKSTECFHPEDYEGTYQGPMTLRNALAQSINVVAVKMLYLATPKSVSQTLSDFGITTLTDPRRYGLSLVLGGGEVKLVDLTEAYSVLATEGVKHPQTMVLEVKDAQGNVLENYSDSSEKVMDPQPVREINDVLSDVTARSGLFGASLNLTTFPDHEVALKTGTTNDYRDAWAMGYTPSLVVGVWAGNNDNSPMQRKGGSILAAVPIWSQFMNAALKNMPPDSFTKPDPATPAKPFFGGQYIVDGQIHTVLQYIDRNDPSGPAPASPGSDPQYNNWEAGVLAWSQQNVGTLIASLQNQISAQSRVTISSPALGSTIGLPAMVQATAYSPEPIVTVRIYFNGTLVQQYNGQFPSPYSFATPIASLTLEPQNLIEVEAVGTSGKSTRSSVIVYGPATP